MKLLIFPRFALVCLFILFCSLRFASTFESIDPELKARVDDFVQNVFLPNAGITSLGLTIFQNGNLYTTGYGMANKEKQIPNGNETQFLIGSITKSLTSVVAVKVLSEKFPELGEAVLDTPIRKLIPSANFTLVDRFRSEHGTFRDLLAHRMCIPSDDLQLGSEPFNSTAEITYRWRYAEEVCAIRTRFVYSNEMFVMAGQLLAHLADKSYEDLVHDLLVDIGMLNSTLGTKSDDFSSMEFRAQPYYILNNASHPMNTDLLNRLVDSNAAGGLWSTPNDMAKYLEFHLNLGKVGEKQIIPQDVMKWLRRNSNIPPVQYDDQEISNYLGYGLGIVLGVYDGWEHLSHSGFFAPYKSHLFMFPAQKIGIFSSTNEGPILVDQIVLHEFIFEVLSGKVNAEERALQLLPRTVAAKKLKKEKTRKVWANFIQKFETSTMANYSDVIGNYGSGPSGEVEISEKFYQDRNSTELYLSYGKWTRGWLENQGVDKNTGAFIYKILWDTDIVQEFYSVGDPGEIYVHVYNQTLDFLLSDSPENVMPHGRFWLGVNLDKLPPIPWNPDSC